MSLLNGLRNASNVAYTENGALAYKTTKSSIVDFFGSAGAMRTRSESDILKMFWQAFAEDSLIATKMMYYFRDIRKGQGERRLFKIILKDMAYKTPDIVLKNLQHVAEFGRYDDYLVLLDTPLKNNVVELLTRQLTTDMKSENPSLLAKWCPSLNASSKHTKRYARIICDKLKLTDREYRKMLSSLRKKINIIETKLSTKNYAEIDYSQVPSNANKKYLKAFWRNDEERYSAFVNRVKKAIETGDKSDKKAKINVKALYPYEIIKNIINSSRDRWGCSSRINPQEDLTLDVMWKSLPDYINGNDKSALAVIDTSGSMTSNDNLPISAAISLGVYFAERITGKFANTFISFSTTPKLIDIKGDDIATKARSIYDKSEISDTNIQAVFDLILNIAVRDNLPQSEIPDRIIIISDMEFNSCTSGINRNTDKLFQRISASWTSAGYKFPRLTFWNVDARQQQYPMTIDTSGIQFVSGFSPTIFSAILKDEFKSPLNLVLDVINVERYNCITV